MWSVYVLEDNRGRFHYVGMSKDVPRRFEEHCAGKVKSTKGHLPLRLTYTEVVGSITDARRRERYLKSAAGKKWLKKKVGGSLPD